MLAIVLTSTYNLPEHYNLTKLHERRKVPKILDLGQEVL